MRSSGNKLTKRSLGQYSQQCPVSGEEAQHAAISVNNIELALDAKRVDVSGDDKRKGVICPFPRFGVSNRGN
jgi:hypothetical protein